MTVRSFSIARAAREFWLSRRPVGELHETSAIINSCSSFKISKRSRRISS